MTSEKNNWTILCVVGYHLMPVLKPRVASSNQFTCGIVLQVDKESIDRDIKYKNIGTLNMNQLSCTYRAVVICQRSCA